MFRFRPLVVPLLVSIKNPRFLDSHAPKGAPEPTLQCLLAFSLGRDRFLRTAVPQWLEHGLGFGLFCQCPLVSLDER